MAGAQFGCGGGGGGGGGAAPAPTATPAPGTVVRDILISGVLNIVGNSLQAPSLLGNSADATLPGNYRVNCVTFEDEPKAGKADVSTSGEFSATLKNFAGVPFGCFLLQKQEDNSYVSLSTIVFDQTPGEGGDEDSQLVAGSGGLKVALSYDADTGGVSAVVDVAESDALKAEKIAAATAAADVDETALPNITGTYGLQCTGLTMPDGSAGQCPASLGGPNEGVPSSIYLHEFADGGERKVGIWPSKEALVGCFGSTNPSSELTPNFGAKLSASATRVEFDLSSLDSLKVSLDELLDQLPTTALQKIVSATETTWQVKDCKRMEQQATQMQEAFSDTSCRFFAPGVEIKEGFDHEGNKFEWEMLKWYNSLTDLDADLADGNAKTIADSSANLVQREMQCWNPKVSAPKDNMPPCPPDVAESSTEEVATTTFWEYKVGTWSDGTPKYRPANFACSNPFDGGSSLMQFPVVADTKAENITSVKDNFGGGQISEMRPECEKVSDIPWLAGTQMYVAQANEVRRAFLDLMRQAGRSEDKGEDTFLCSRLTKPSNVLAFNFKGWNETANGGYDIQPTTAQPMWDQAGGKIFWNRWIWQQMRIKPEYNATTGVLTNIVADTNAQQQPWFDYGFADAGGFCPNVDPMAMPGETSHEEWAHQLQDACRTEFLGAGTLAQKLDKIFTRALDPRNNQPSEIIQCSGDTTLNTFLSGLTTNSCVPDFEVFTRCDYGKCVETLRCWGTDDGACTDETGKYKGRVPGRFELMTLKPRVAGNFDMSSFTTESWEYWDNGEAKVCKRSRAMFIQGKVVSATVFDGTMANKEGEYCEGEEAHERAPEPTMELRFTKQ